MPSSPMVILLGLFALATAAPWPTDFPKCSTECPVTGSSLLSYTTGKTYTYSYAGKTQTHLKDIKDGISKMEWSSQVAFTWLSPCDVAITFNNPVVDGSTGIADAGYLTRYPLVMAVSDGRVQHVCTHPDDETWSINLKKGVASSFQNSLPTTAPISSGLEFTETDVVGKCPTKYTVKHDGNTIMVKKVKFQRSCQHRYPTPFETPNAWLKAPLPLEESKSKCTQEITNGIYTSITCEDKTIVRPSYGVYKYVKASQESTLHYQSDSSESPESISNLRGRLVHKSLLYDHETLKKDPSLISQLDETLKQVCEKTKSSIEHDAAPLMAKVVHLLRHIPGDAIESTLQKITSGQICSEHQRLEALYLDAIAFVHEPGTVKIIVKQLVSGRAIGGRAALYAAALHLTPRPNVQAIEALQPLFETSKILGSAKLAAASLVHTYCHHNPDCQHNAPVRHAAEALANKIQQHCTPSGGDEAEQITLASLKALGNMGVIDSEVARSVIMCLKTDGVQNIVRVAAAQAFRNAKCQKHTTKQLVNIMTDQSKNTEVRIASYLAAVRCAEKEDLDKIIDKLIKEVNTQVRGFVLSHLLNLQRSSASHNENLRFLLTSVVVPINFTEDFRKYSRNIDMSYYIQSLGVGAGIGSDVIYAPGSYLPRSINVNLTTALGDIPVNLGEFGVRTEGLEPIMKKLFGPRGYFQETSIGKIFHDFMGVVEGKGPKLFENVVPNIRQRRSIDFSTISNFLKKIYGRDQSDVQRADVFARFGGQEMAYGSWSGNLNNIDFDNLAESFFNFFDELLDQLTDINVDTARTAQMKLDYSLPSIQGIPLKLQLEGTAVFGIKMGSKLNGVSGADNINLVEVFPGLSLQMNGFVGYDMYLAKSGIKMENLISSNNGLSISLNVRNRNELQFEVNFPEKMKLFNIKSETYIMKVVKGHQETKIIPHSVKSIRIQKQSCLHGLQSAIGLRLCYDLNVPNIFRSEGLPLGQQSVIKMFVEKTDPSMSGYLLRASVNNNEGSKVIHVKLESQGSSTPRSVESTVTYKREQNNHIISASIESSSIHSSILINVIQQDEYKAIETFAKWNSNGMESLGGIKIEFRKQWTGPKKEIEFNVYSSHSHQFPSKSRIIEVILTENRNDQEVNVDLVARTKSSLQQLIVFNFEVGVDLRHISDSENFVPQRLRKLELLCHTENLIVVSHIQKTSETDYSSLFKITQMNTELLAIQGSHHVEGSSMDRDMEIKTSAKGHFLGASYKWSFDIAHKRDRKGVVFIVKRQTDHMKIIDIQAMYSVSSEMYDTRFVVDLPEYMKAIKIVSKLTSQQQDKYMLEAAFKQGSEVVLDVNGPITARSSLSSSYIQADIKITPLSSGSHTVSTTLDWSSKQQVFKVMIKKEQEMLFNLDWLFTVDRMQQWTIKTKLNAPIIVDTSMEVVIKDKAVHVNMNNQLFPMSSSPRRIKGLANVNFERLNTQLEVSWDADRDPTKKLTLDVNLAPNALNSGVYSLAGNVNYMGESYGLSFEASGFNNHRWTNLWQRELNLVLTNPSRKTMLFNTKLKLERKASPILFEISLLYKDFEDKKYQYKNVMTLQDYYASGSFKLNTHSRYKSPDNQVTIVETEAKYIDILSERVLNLKIKTSSSLLPAPMTVEFLMDNKIDIYTTLLKVDTGTPLNIFKWEILHHPYRGIQRIIVDLDMAVAVKLLETIHQLVNTNYQSSSIHAPLEIVEAIKYHFHYNLLSPYRYAIGIQSPSRTVEGEVNLSPDEFSVKLNLNKGRSDSNYEITATTNGARGAWSNQQAEWQGHIRHPSLTRDIKAVLRYRREGDQMRGTIELDIFHDEADKIIGTMKSTRLSPNSIMVEASLSARALKINPKITVTAAYAPHILSFDFKFRKTPSSEVSLLMAGKIDRSHGREAALAFTLHKENEPVIELSGSITPEDNPQCRGLGIKALTHVSGIGRYNLHSKVCNPGFLQISASNQRSLHVNIIKIGYKDPGDFELSITSEDKTTLQEFALLMAKVSLASPTMINIDLARAANVLQRIKNTGYQELEKLASVVSSWIREFLSHIKGGEHLQGSQFPPSDFFKLIEEFKRELKIIQQDLVHDVIENPVVIKIKPYVVRVVSRLVELQRDLRNRRDIFIKDLQDDLRGLQDSLMNVAMKMLEMLMNGEGSGLMTWIINVIQRVPLVHEVEQYIEDLIQKYPEDFEAFKEIISKTVERFEEDVDDLRDWVRKIPPIHKNIIWLLGNYDQVLGLQMDKLITHILHDFLLISVKTEDHHLRITIPSYRPIHSLIQAMRVLSSKPETMFTDLLWQYYSFEPIAFRNIIWGIHSFLPRRAHYNFPPYNRTAIITEGTEILTFDGVVLRGPRSPCKILLAAYESNFLIMEHPQHSSPQQLTLKTPEVVVVINPKYQVLINGQEMKGSQETRHKVQVTKISGEIVVQTPFMAVHIYEKNQVVSVEVSGWTFGEIAGLLGSYDGEIANDWLMPSGSKASSYQELVHSWQEDQQCPTPVILPVDPFYVQEFKILKCNAMLGARSLCSSVVDPKPFILMCYATRDVCDAEKAYQAMCATKGLQPALFSSC